MARAATTTDAFNAIAEARRRDILVALTGGEVAVGEIVDQLHLSQPQVSKHLGVLRAVDLVRCRTVGRHRLYRLNGAALRPVHDWIGGFEALWNDRLDRLDDLLTELQQEETPMTERSEVHVTARCSPQRGEQVTGAPDARPTQTRADDWEVHQ